MKRNGLPGAVARANKVVARTARADKEAGFQDAFRKSLTRNAVDVDKISKECGLADLAQKKTLDTWFEKTTDSQNNEEGDKSETLRKVNRPLVIIGPGGSGKSTFVARWADEKRRELASGEQYREDTCIIDYYIGATRQSLQLCNLLFQMCQSLMEFFQLSIPPLPHNERGLVKAFHDILGEIGEDGSRFCAIIFDGVELLQKENGNVASLSSWIPDNLGSNVRIAAVATVNDQDLVDSISCGDHVPAFLTDQEDNLLPSGSAVNGGSLSGPSIDETSQLREEKVCHDILRKQYATINFEIFSSTITEKVITSYISNCSSQDGNENLSSRKELAPMDSTGSPRNTAETNEVYLLDCHIARIAEKFKTLRCVDFLFETLRGAALAAQMNFDVNGFVQQCTEERLASSDEILDQMVQFFARGNYPTRRHIQSAWEAVCSSESSDRSGQNVSTSKRPLLPREEIERRSEIRSILFGTSPNSLFSLTDDSKEDGDEYADDFDDGEENPSTPTTKEVSTPESTRLDQTPIYLLGGMKIEPPGDWLMKAVGYICSARYGLTNDEISEALTAGIEAEEVATEDKNITTDPSATRKNEDGLIETGNTAATPSGKKKLHDLAENSFEEWLFNDSIVSSPGAKNGQASGAKESRVPQGVAALLEQLLPHFGRVQFKGIISVPMNNLRFRGYVSKFILYQDSYALSKHAVSLLGESIEKERMAIAEARMKSLEKLKSHMRANVANFNHHVQESNSLAESSVETKDPSWVEDTVKIERKNMAARWKLILVKVFTGKKLTQRKAEEYPWLLECNGRWASLQMCVSNIEMFSLLWNDVNVFRFDIIRFWRRLSSTCRARSIAAADTADLTSSLFEETIIHDDIDAALDESFDLAGGSKSTVKKRAGQPVNVLQKYDPVEQYVKSSEEFLLFAEPRSVKPGQDPTKIMRLCGNVMVALCEFFWEFGEYEHLAPLYLHPPVPEEELETIKISLPHRNADVLKSCNREGLGLHLSQTDCVIQKLAEIRDEMIMEQHLSQRQVAVSKLHDEEQKVSKTIKRSRSRFINLVLRQHKEIERKTIEERKNLGLIFEGNKDGENFYSYQRWIWIQYPAMAMLHATSVRIMTNRDKSKSVAVPRMKLRHSKIEDRFKPRSKRIPTVLEVKKRQTVDFWTRKKQDPALDRPMPRRISKSLPLLDLIPTSEEARNELQTTIPEDEDESETTIQTTESTGSLLKVSVVADPAILCRGVGPFLHEVSKLPKNTVPFSSPTNRTINHGTRFPTFDKSQKETSTDEILNIFHGGILDNQAIQESFKTVAMNNNHTSGVSFVSSNLPAHLQSYPTTEQDARVAEVQGMLSSFRKQLNELRFKADAKEGELEDLMQQVYERDKIDHFTQQSINSGESLVSDLNERFDNLREETGKAEHTNRFLTRVFEVCETYPARVEKHILQLEGRLSCMRDDRLSLAKDLDEIKTFTLRTNEEQIPKLKQEIERRSELHRTVLNKLERWRIDECSQQNFKSARNQNRLVIIEQTKQQSLTLEQIHRGWERPHRQMLYENVLGPDYMPLLEEKKQRETFRKLCKLAKAKDAPSICAKYLLLDEKGNDLESQRQEAEAKLDEVRKTLQARIDKRKELDVQLRKQAKANGKMVVEQLNRKCESAELRLFNARSEYRAAEKLVEDFTTLVVDLQTNMATKLPTFEVHDFPGSNQPEMASQVDTERVEHVREVFVHVLNALGVLNVDIPNALSINAHANKPRPSNASEQQHHAGSPARSLARTQSRSVVTVEGNDIQRRKFLFGSGLRKPNEPLVNIPPRITRRNVSKK